MIKVINLDSALAATVFYSVTIPHCSRSEISEVDLENYLAKAVWKSFDSLKSETAARLGVNEIDLILTGARVVGLKIDGYEVLNLHGFVGRRLEISLCLTMVKRDVLAQYGRGKKGECLEFFEEGSVIAYLLSKLLGADYLWYAAVRSNLTRVFLVAPGKTSYLGEFAWGEADIARIYAEHFKVPLPTAWAIYQKFLTGGVSKVVAGKLKKLFYSAFQVLINNLTLEAKKLVGLGVKKLPPLYLSSDFDLPKELHKKSLALGKKRLRLYQLEKDITVGDLVFNPPYNVYEWLNQLVKRRIKWLLPQ